MQKSAMSKDHLPFGVGFLGKSIHHLVPLFRYKHMAQTRQDFIHIHTFTHISQDYKKCKNPVALLNRHCNSITSVVSMVK